MCAEGGHSISNFLTEQLLVKKKYSLNYSLQFFACSDLVGFHAKLSNLVLDRQQMILMRIKLSDYYNYDDIFPNDGPA